METTEAKGPKIVAECEAVGEPYFVLRAKDLFSMDSVLHYFEQVRTRGPSKGSFEDDILRVIEDFGDWRRTNAEKVRYPD